MMLFVGQASIKGDFRKYAKHFNYVELLAEPQVLPNLKKLASLAKEANEKVQFGVVLSPRAWGPQGAAFLSYFYKVVKACSPTWVTVRTPTSLRPGPSSERDLRERFDALRAKVGGAKLGWEARGLWEPAAIARVARELGVVAVWDGYSLPGFSLGEGENYVRFSALGVSGRVNEGRLERLAVQAQDGSSLFVVVEGKGGLKTRQLLSSLLEDPFAGVEDAMGLEDDSLDGDDEGVLDIDDLGGVPLHGDELDDEAGDFDGSSAEDDHDDDDTDGDEDADQTPSKEES